MAAGLAQLAGQVLLRRRAAAGGLSDTELRAIGDRSAQRLLADELARCAPGDAVLSEEAVDDPARLSASRVWIIDPLDGTREYAEGRDDFAVHVALWQDGALVAGAVALPARGELYSSGAPPNPPAGERGGPIRLAVSRSRPPEIIDRLRSALAADVVAMGSAGVKVMAVATGSADAYVHAGGQYEWDSAAPVAVARAAGLWASRLDGSPLRYNQPDPYLPDLLVCREADRDRLLDAIRATSGVGTAIWGAHDT